MPRDTDTQADGGDGTGSQNDRTSGGDPAPQSEGATGGDAEQAEGATGGASGPQEDVDSEAEATGEAATTSEAATADDKTAREQETQKSYRTILAQEIEEGYVELNRPASGLFLSGLSAGLDIGFGPFLMVAVLSLPSEGLPAPIRTLLVSAAYAVGFTFVVLGKSDLFTEQTTLAVLPVLHGRATYRELGKVWAIVYGANILGAAGFAGLAVVIGPATGHLHPAAFREVAGTLVAYSWWVTLVSGVLAGWLMGLLSWLVRASRDTISLLFVVFIVTGTIGYLHLPHSIAGTIEVLFGVFVSGSVSPAAFGTFLLWSTLGNVVGGVVFVALLKHSHAMRGGEDPGRVVVGRHGERGGGMGALRGKFGGPRRRGSPRGSRQSDRAGRRDAAGGEVESGSDGSRAGGDPDDASATGRNPGGGSENDR
ncbi:MAG: formate/nitrite transporter family protein [Salinigranum sp.]